MKAHSNPHRAIGAAFVAVLGLAALSLADEPTTKPEGVRVPVIQSIQIGSNVRDLQVSKDGKLLAIGSDRSVGILYDLDRSEEVEFKGYTGPVTRVAISPEAGTLATGSDDKTIRLWKIPDAKQTGEIKDHAAPITGLAFSPDGKVLASGASGGNLLFHEAGSNRLIGKVERLGEGITRLAYSANGKYVAVALATGQIALVEPEEPYRLLLSPVTHSARIWGLAVSSDSKAVVAADQGGLVQVYDPVSGRAGSGTRVEGGATGLAFSPDDKLLAVGGWDKGRIYLLDWPTMRIVAQWEGHGSVNAQYGLVFSPDGTKLYSGSGDGTVKVWRLEQLPKPKE
jgi:WD40 repeat protein